MENKKWYFGVIVLVIIISIEGYFIYNKTNLHVFFCVNKKKIKPIPAKSMPVDKKIYVELYTLEV